MFYDVLVVRYGKTSVEADSLSDAANIVRCMSAKNISWSEKWDVVETSRRHRRRKKVRDTHGT